MKTVKLSVFVIGVALSAAPIFNSAFAQDRNGQTSVMIELQTLRTEIAELRDLVERQQFEMQKLKRSVAKQNQVLSQPENGVRSQQYGNQSSFNPLPTTGGVDSVNQTEPFRQASQDPNSYSVGSGSQVQGRPNNGVESDYYSASENSSNENSSVVGQSSYQNESAPANDYSQFERPTDVASSEAQASEYSDASNGIGDASAPQVVEREITAAPIESTDYSDTGPEIVERSISTASGAVNAPVLSQDQPYNTQGQQIERSYGVDNGQPSEVTSHGSAAQTDIQAYGEQYENASPNPNLATGRPILAVPVDKTVTPSNSGLSASVDAEGVNANPVVASPAQFSEDDFYDRGFGLLKESKYDEAVNVFKEQIVQHPAGSLADDAHYWIAEAMFINRKPAEARPHLKSIINDFPQSARVPDAMLKSAYIEQEMGNLIEARILFQEIVSRHPSSNAAIAAKNRLSNLKIGQ